MDFLDKFKNRYNIIITILSILMLILSFRLATLTIAQGDHYRYVSDNKRLKEIYTTAPRGEIRDRYGRLLAGNISSFTVQLLKDEINLLSRDEKNDAFLRLIRLLEEDGVNYVDEFPIELNVFAYKSEADYRNEYLAPLDKVLDIIIENNLLNQVLNTYYVHGGYKEHYPFITANSAINALKYKGIGVPINTSIVNGQLVIEFDENKDIQSWKTKNGVRADASPTQTLEILINNDKAIIRKIVDNSISRLLVYDLLKSRNLDDNLTMEEYSISYKESYLNRKRTLASSYPQVTMESSAEEDFVNIFTQTSLKRFLERSIDIGKDKSEIIIPGKILLEMLEEKGVNVPLEIETGEDGVSALYNYTGSENIGDQNPIDILINLSKEASILTDFITSEDIRSLAQEQLLNDGVNPRISVAKEFEYVDINNLNKFYTQNKIEEDSTIEEAFEALRENYEIDESLSKYEIRPIFILYNQLRNQGYLAYQPTNIAYGIKDSTVAKIEESLMEVPGIYISVEPVRYYPEGTTAAHVLGYLGKISQPNEIERYVEEQGYSPSAIIGKTGIEESFEEQLSGISGIRKVEVDSVGNTTNVLEEIKPVPGDNLYLTIDLKLQQKAEEALEQTLREIQRGGTYESPWGNFKFGIRRSEGRPYIHATSGAVVAIDVKTGQVLASVSYPAYDPNLFATGISTTDWESLLPENEKDLMAPRPLYNIATQTATEPGSIFKMITGLAALENGLSPTKTVRDMGFVTIGNKPFYDLLWTTSRRTHGNINLYDALKDSCNYYFYTLALGYNQKTGESLGTRVSVDDIADMSTKFGLNERTGVEISESSGILPSPQRKLAVDQNMLRRLLNANIHHAFPDDFKLDEEYKEEIIEEIVSWMGYEEKLSRGEVIRRLSEMGIEPEKPMPRTITSRREGLADIIKYTYIDSGGWNIGETLYVSIGQGQGAYTPIQMANYVATLANGGYRHKLSLVDNIKNYNNSKINYSHQVNPERIELNNYENLEHVKKGMNLVAKDGTARATFANFPIEVGVKTGTAQKDGTNPATGEDYDDFSWFVGFAPYDEPEIAVAAVIFQGGSGGYSGPLVRDIMAEYLGLNKTDAKDKLPYENSLSE